MGKFTKTGPHPFRGKDFSPEHRAKLRASRKVYVLGIRNESEYDEVYAEELAKILALQRIAAATVV